MKLHVDLKYSAFEQQIRLDERKKVVARLKLAQQISDHLSYARKVGDVKTADYYNDKLIELALTPL